MIYIGPKFLSAPSVLSTHDSDLGVEVTHLEF